MSDEPNPFLARPLGEVQQARDDINTRWQGGQWVSREDAHDLPLVTRALFERRHKVAADREAVTSREQAERLSDDVWRGRARDRESRGAER